MNIRIDDAVSNRQYLKSIYDHIDMAIFAMDVVDGPDFVFVGLNPAHERLTGLRSDDIRGKRPGEFLPAELAATVRANYLRCLETGSPIEYEEALPFLGGQTFWRTRLIPVRGGSGDVTTIIGTSIPITDLRLAERAARDELRFQETLLATVPFPVFYTDLNLKLIGANDAARNVFGIGPDWDDAASERRLMDAESAIALASSLRACVDSGRDAVTRVHLRRLDGMERIVEAHQAAFADDTGSRRGVVAVLLDITERIQSEDRLKALAINDEMTGLLNRRGYAQLVYQEWRKSCRQETDVSAIMLDIDHFKAYNDRYGHQAGDGVIRAVADCVRRAVRRPADLLCRYGGEEIFVLLPSTALDGARVVAERIAAFVRDLRLPHEASPTDPCLTVSMGVATARAGHGQACGDANLESLVGEADARLYAAKNSGRNKIVWQ